MTFHKHNCASFAVSSWDTQLYFIITLSQRKIYVYISRLLTVDRPNVLNTNLDFIQQKLKTCSFSNVQLSVVYIIGVHRYYWHCQLSNQKEKWCTTMHGRMEIELRMGNCSTINNHIQWQIRLSIFRNPCIPMDALGYRFLQEQPCSTQLVSDKVVRLWGQSWTKTPNDFLQRQH